ncbi:UPF0182 family protein [Phormidium sp. CLA17]|nr:UPF0182 family protein [Leptolyngbya sp. Cla-17]
MRSPRLLRLLRWLLVLLTVGWFLLGIGCQIVAESLWFKEVGYAEALWVRLGTKSAVWSAVTSVSLLWLLGNLWLAKRLQHPKNENAEWKWETQLSTIPNPLAQRQKRRAAPHETIDSPSISFGRLVLLALGLSIAIAVLVFHQVQTGVTLWQAKATQTLLPVPDRFQLKAIWNVGKTLLQSEVPFPYSNFGFWIALVIALLIFPQFLLSLLAIALSVGFGFVLSANWSRILLFFHASPFNRADPLFSKDIGFYIFSLPIWQLLEFWLVGLSAYSLLAVSLIYLLSGNSLSQGRFIGISGRQQRHLCGLAGCWLLVVGLGYWLSHYELLYSTQGVVFGAGYTDVWVNLPVCLGMALLAIAIALPLFGYALPKHRLFAIAPHFSDSPLTKSSAGTRDRPSSVPLPFLLLVSYFLLVPLTTVLPMVVQNVIVQPNELAREQPFISRNISLTRAAFGLENIQVETFNPSDKLTYADIEKNEPTIGNIRLWDTRPLLATNRQLQQIRPYYRFADADIDRYTLASQPNEPAAIQQVLIAARELDYSAVPTEAKTWVNEHLVYTHGYGFTMSPVNEVAPGGLPDYFVKDIGTNAQAATGALNTSNPAIRANIPIGQPRIYYGEISNTYVMTGGQLQELDYPSGSENVYNTYAGEGGVAIAPFWKRLLFARYLNDWQMVLTNYFTPKTKLLFRRNILDRVQAIAPFLHYDHDPYIVTADIGCQGLNLNCQNPTPTSTATSSATPNYLYWMLDAYTTSDHYPYSQPSLHLAQATNDAKQPPLNYMRNAVKVVIDAYNGSVNFYIADPSDPMIQSWAAIFPGLFKPLSAMPAALQSHLRYPADLFGVQSERLMTYHMTDPKVFYNQEDQWQIPDEIYRDETQPVDPYFLITNLPTVEEAEEFILLLPFKPRQRTNLTAWLAARSDGASYGKQLLYVFPKGQLVYGIEQIEARINQDPVISQKITLWNRVGSRALQGNLLVVPIEQSLLYVEPLYLEAEKNSLPTLVSVIVAYGNRIAIADSFAEALKAIFQPQQPVTPAIVRPVE